MIAKVFFTEGLYERAKIHLASGESSFVTLHTVDGDHFNFQSFVAAQVGTIEGRTISGTTAILAPERVCAMTLDSADDFGDFETENPVETGADGGADAPVRRGPGRPRKVITESDT